MSIETSMSYAKQRPILIGVVTVLTVFSAGVGIAFATGLVTPTQVMAQVLPPCCTPPPAPAPPPPPPPPPPPAPAPAPAPAPVTPAPAPLPPPTCNFDANPSTITQGYSSNLSWSTQNADTVSIDQGIGGVGTSGSRTVNPSQTTTYDLTATSNGTTVHCTTTVTVTIPTPAPTCTLSANPTSIQNGGSSTLSWNTTNANSVSINQSIGSVNTSGSRNVSPSQTTSYDLTAIGNGGTIHCYATVTVTQIPSPTCTLTASPASITTGGASTLNWGTTNAASISISPTVGAVASNGSRNVSPTQTTTYDLTASGNGGTVHCYTTVTVNQPPQAPSCTISANPTSIQNGQSSVVSWTSNNATSASLTGFGAVSTGGSVQVSPTQTTTYTLTVTGPGGTANCNTTVVVTQAPQPPTCTLSASPSSITTGGASTLNWGTTNATSVTIDQGVGSVGTFGSRTVAPAQTTNYTLTATGAGGTVRCYTSVTVNQPPQPPTCTLNANPTSITTGGASTLSWTTSNATSVSINQGIGAVSPGGSMNVTPWGTTTYTLTATGNGGSVNCQTTITVNQPPQPPTCTLSASPTSVLAGNSATLSWSTTNANSVTISTLGSVSLGGSVLVSPSQTTTYGLTATGANGTVNCQATVTVVQPNPPICTLNASPNNIQQGGSSNLSWTTSGATSFSVDQGIGNVQSVQGGSIGVWPSQTTTYTGTAVGPGGVAHCSTTVVVTIVPPTPSCTLTASPNSIQQGGSSTITWTSVNATSGSLSGVGSISPVSGGSTVVSPGASSTYTLTVSGAGGTATCQTIIYVVPPSNPSCTLSAVPTSITQGSAATLSWTTSNASAVSISSVGTVSVNGSVAVAPSVTTTYTLTATGANSTSVNCSTTIVVVTPEAPTCTLTATPQVIQQGGASTLSWTTNNATSVSINQGIGAVATAASRNVAPTQTTTYTLTATGPGGTVVCPAPITVTVTQPPPAPTCTLSASPASVNYGGSSTLIWTTANATTVTLADGTNSSNVATSGSGNITPTHTTNYALTASGAGGTITCPATVVVVTPSPTCTLSANPGSINSNGQTTLTWNTTNATSFVIDQGVGSMSPVTGGAVTVTPGGSRTYTGTATGAGGTVTCATTVSTNTYNPGPSCTLSVSPSNISSGDSARIYWNSTNTNNVHLDQGIGDVNASGSRSVSPNGQGVYTYVGTFYGTNGNVITCSATLRVDTTQPHIVLDSLPVTGNPVSYVYLADLPYTGLDLGPVGTALYWLMLVLWSLAIAYLVLGNALPFALRRMGIFGGEMSYAVNEPVYAPIAHAPVAHTQVAYVPAMHSVAAPVRPVASRTYSSYEGFKALADNGTLTVDDIVKGLSRETETHSYVAPTQHATPIANVVEQITVMTAPVAHTVEVPVAKVISQDVPSFIKALVAGEKETVFAIIRDINKTGGDAQAFLTHVVVALDDAFRAHTDGTAVHPEIAQATAGCAPSFLERLVSSLSTAVDSSYSAGVTGVKMAVTRALQVVEG